MLRSLIPTTTTRRNSCVHYALTTRSLLYSALPCPALAGSNTPRGAPRARGLLPRTGASCSDKRADSIRFKRYILCLLFARMNTVVSHLWLFLAAEPHRVVRTGFKRRRDLQCNTHCQCLSLLPDRNGWFRHQDIAGTESPETGLGCGRMHSKAQCCSAPRITECDCWDPFMYLCTL